MPRALTESAKKRRLEKEQRVIEEPANVPDNLKQSTIEFLYRTGKNAKEIISFTGIRSQTVYDCIKRFKETGTAAPAARSGRPVSALSAQNILKVRKIISKNPEKSQAEIAKKIGISEASMSNLVRKKLKSRSYRMGRGPLLTDAHKENRLEKSKRMLAFVNEKPDRINRVLFTDEKIFPIGRYLNRQNHRQILKRITKHRRWKTIGHTGFPKTVTVWAGVSGMGKTKLAFLDQGVRINSGVYQSKILKKRAKPDSQKIFGHNKWWFQQDWAPAHGSRSTLSYCHELFKGRYWDKTMWPSNSPDLNPLDFSIWGLLEQRLDKRRYRSVKELKMALKRAWKTISADELRRIAENFRKRLQACIQAKGGHFEHLLR